MSETKMLRLPNGSMPKNEGEFAWDESETYCRMMLPGKHFTNLPTERAAAATVRWQWNGSLDRPTFAPSVRVFIQFEGRPQEELWHGFITDGVMRSC
jgi:hypothetical protein